MQWTPVVVVAREQPWQSTGVYTVLLLAGGQQPAWVEMKVVQSVEFCAVAAMAKSQAAEARMERILMLLTVICSMDVFWQALFLEIPLQGWFGVDYLYQTGEVQSRKEGYTNICRQSAASKGVLETAGMRSLMLIPMSCHVTAPELWQ